MSRNENEDVSHLNLPDPVEIDVTYYLENDSIMKGEQYVELARKCTELQNIPPTICAKHIINPQTKIHTFFVLCAGSNLYDPHNKSRLRISTPWKMRKVTRTTFDLYKKFLRTNHKTFLYQAERGI